MSAPELVVTFDSVILMPIARSVPFAAVPVIVIFPASDEMLVDANITPKVPHPVPHEVPLTVSEPVLVVTVAAFAKTP